MMSSHEHSWSNYEERRSDVREFFIEKLHCDPERFDFDLTDCHGRTDFDILADAMTLCIMVAEIAEGFDDPFSMTRFVPGYVEDSRFRRRVDGLMVDYLDAPPDEQVLCRYKLLTYCLRNGGPTTITLPADSPCVQPPIDLVCEAVANLGGMLKAAAMTGIPVETLQSLALGGQAPTSDKLDLLFKLAGIVHNPDRIGVQFRSVNGASASGPHAS